MPLTLASDAITFTNGTSLSSGIIGTAQLSAGVVQESFASTSGAFNFRNKIINGSFDIWQRGTTFTNQKTIPGGFRFAADRWIGNRNAEVNGQTITRYIVSSTDRTSAGVCLPRYGMQWQRAVGNADTSAMYQYYTLETQDSIPLAGRTITLSFYAKRGSNYSGGTLDTIIYSGTGTDQSVYNFSGLTSVVSRSFNISTSMTRYTVTGTVPTNSTQIGIQMSWTPTGTGGADDSVYITGVQLEEGSIATSFEPRPFSIELSLCQRYFEKSYETTSPPGSATVIGMSQMPLAYINNVLFIRFATEKRTTPVISYWDAAGTGSRVSWWNTSYTRSDGNSNLAVPIQDPSTKGFGQRHSNDILGAVTLGLHWTADAEI